MGSDDAEWGAPGYFNLVGEVGEDFGVAAEMKVKRLLNGDGAAAIAALVAAGERA
jgi:hypothetical protein